MKCKISWLCIFQWRDQALSLKGRWSLVERPLWRVSVTAHPHLHSAKVLIVSLSLSTISYLNKNRVQDRQALQKWKSKSDLAICETKQDPPPNPKENQAT